MTTAPTSTAITERMTCQRNSSRWSMKDISALVSLFRLLKKSRMAIFYESVAKISGDSGLAEVNKYGVFSLFEFLAQKLFLNHIGT